MATRLHSMHIGLLDERITLQRNTPTVNSRGAETRVWANFASVPTVRARVQAAPGGERVQDNRELPVSRHTVTIRWRTDITPDDRVIWHASGGDRTLAIDDLGDPDNMRRWLQLACYEVVGEEAIG